MSLFDSMMSGFGFGGGDTKTPRRRNLLDVASRPKKPDTKPFSLTDSVGVYGSNRPKDVKKMERGLDSLGFMAAKKTGNSKGRFSAPLRQGMQAFQKANKLAVDGQANANGPTATTLSQQLKKIRERREELKSPLAASKPFTSKPAPKPLAPKPLKPKPFATKQSPSPTFPEKPKPWWRTRRPEKMPDEDYSSTRRTMEGMLKYGDDGDLPNLYADSIRDGGHKAANEMGEFLRQLEEAAPKRVKGFEKAVFNMLNDYQKKTYFPEVFGKKSEKKPLLQQAAYRPEEDKGITRNRSYPIMGDGGGNDLRIQTAQNTSKSGSQGPATAQTKQPSPPMTVPAYRKQAKGLQAKDWSDWSNSLGKLSNLSPAERRAYSETFAAEGGYANDPNSSASSGITQDVLDRAIKEGTLPGVKMGISPDQLSMERRAKVYRHYFDDALRTVDRKVPGSSILQRIGNKEASTAFADAMFAHGRHGGAKAIQKAINKVAPGSASEDGNMGPKTFEAYRRLVGNPKTNRALLDALGDARWDMVKGGKDAAGWLPRINHFRFQKAP